MPKYQLLPAQTAPADAALTRRHPPPDRNDYKVFRECLRWEFGFSCAICLLHERDIIPYLGAEGWGVTQVEHLVPQSHNAKLAGVYTNLLYICVLCNGARSNTDLIGPNKEKLLEPTKDVWSKHFFLENDELRPVNGDKDAEYTADAYNINDARKVKLRRIRRAGRADKLAEINARQKDVDAYNEFRGYGEPSKERAALEGADRARASLIRSQTELICETWVPIDAPLDCRCGLASARTLPAPYLKQVVEYEIP